MITKEKIKQELERLDDKYRELRVSGTTQQAKEADLVVHVLLQISNFIKSLPEEPASKDLDEEIKRYLHEVYDRDTTVSDVARHFANWQKQQMMKNVVECTWGSRVTSPLTSYFPDIKCGDKVKLIIVKEG